MTEKIEQLIKEGQELYQYISQKKQEGIRSNGVCTPGKLWNEISEEKKQDFSDWQAKVKRLVNQSYQSELANIEGIMKKEVKSRTRELLGLLRALKDMPKETEVRISNPSSLVNITNANNNTQSNHQEVNISTSIIIEALREELGNRQMKELEQVITECEKDGATEDLKRSKVIEKLKSLGEGVATNIIASLITNPSIWSGFIG